MLTMFKVIQLIIFFLLVTQSLGRSNFFEEFDEKQGMLSAKELEREFDERQGMLSAKELEREFDERQGMSSDPSTKEPERGDCIKDILILVDASYSINDLVFRKYVVPFLHSFVNKIELNVGPNGTHISILGFSTEERTNMTYGIKFANRTKGVLDKLIKDKITFGQLSGEKTYTGKALEIANKIFGVDSPGNVRKTVEDVVLIITDGKPNGKLNSKMNMSQMNIALSMAAELKKNVLVIPVAVGKKNETDKIEKFLKQLSTDGTVMTTTLKKNMKRTIAKLVNGSCKANKIETRYQECVCVNNIGKTSNLYAKPGEKVKLPSNWKKPTLKCKDHNLSDVTKDPKSPQSFGIGPHTITYIFEGKAAGKDFKGIRNCTVNFKVVSCGCCEATSTVNATLPPGQSKVSVHWTIPKPKRLCPATLTSISPRNIAPGHSFSYGDYTVSYDYALPVPVGSVTCTVHIKVKGELCGGELCGGKPFLTTNQECCCGKVYVKKAGHACCGMFYHDQRATRCCCKNYNVVRRGASCPGE